MRRRSRVGTDCKARYRYGAMCRTSRSRCGCKPKSKSPCLQQQTTALSAIPTTDWSDLADVGIYDVVAACLDSRDLFRVDATCPKLYNRNRAWGCAWHALGEKDFRGIELGDAGMYADGSPAAEDWRSRYVRFSRECLEFCAPFQGTDIRFVQEANDCAELQWRMQTELLVDAGLYIEIEVVSNPDTLTIALVDWSDAGCNSITFSPDAGTVFIEQQVCSVPRRVQGKYLDAMSGCPLDSCFHGRVGVYVQANRIAFFRQTVHRSKSMEVANTGCSETSGCWETTGYIADLQWAESSLLTPCIAFRKAGAYDVHIGKVCYEPPLPLQDIQNATVAAAKPHWEDWPNFTWE